MQKIKLIALMSALAALTFNCSTSTDLHQQKTLSTAMQENNRLVAYGMAVSAPDDWIFKLTMDNAQLLTFSDKENNYLGCMERCSAGFPLSEKDLLLYAKKELPEGTVIIRTAELENPQGKGVLLQCTEETAHGEFCIALVPENRGFYILEFLPNGETAEELFQLSASIASTLTDYPDNYTRRIIADKFDFHELKGMWKWIGDSTLGSRFYRFFPGSKLCIATITETDQNDLIELIPQSTDYSFFTVPLPINNKPHIVSAAGRSLQSHTEAWVLLKGDRNFVIQFTIESKDSPIQASDFLTGEQIKDFFLTVITFEGLQ